MEKQTEEPKAKKKRVEVVRKSAMDWSALLASQAASHWRTIRVTVQVREWLMAGKPAQLDAANAMIKARGLEDVIEARQDAITDPVAREAMAEEVKDEGLCEFHRRDGRPGIWMPSNNVKAGVKENWSVLGYRVEIKGSRGRIAESLFVYGVPSEPDAPPVERDWIYLGEQPDGIDTAVSHTSGPKGPVSSIKRHEYVVRPKFAFDIAVSKDGIADLPDERIASMLLHFGEHGVGACRSKGHGRFDIVSVEDV
jgi:hypothetical protein